MRVQAPKLLSKLLNSSTYKLFHFSQNLLPSKKKLTAQQVFSTWAASSYGVGEWLHLSRFLFRRNAHEAIFALFPREPGRGTEADVHALDVVGRYALGGRGALAIDGGTERAYIAQADATPLAQVAVHVLLKGTEHGHNVGLIDGAAVGDFLRQLIHTDITIQYALRRVNYFLAGGLVVGWLEFQHGICVCVFVG